MEPMMSSSPGILDKFAEAIAKAMVKHVLPPLYEKLTALVPLIAAATVKAVVDRLPGANLIDNLDDIAEDIRGQVNVAIPDIDIPILSDIFDLTEFLNRGKKK